MANSPARKLADLLNDTQSADQLVKTDGSGNLSFADGGPKLIVAPTSVGSGTTFDEQDAAISGNNHIRIEFEGISTDSASSILRLQLYDDGILKDGSTDYGYSFIGSDNGVPLGQSNGNEAYMEMTFNLGGVTVSRDGWIDIVTNTSDRLWITWQFYKRSSTAPDYTTGWGRLDGAVTDFDGFRLLASVGNFDAGTVAVYQLPSWTHT